MQWTPGNEDVAKADEEEGCSPGKQCLCPSCGRDFDVPLLLPCSHTLCKDCVEEMAVSTQSHSLAGPQFCSLSCPCCYLSVELPCWEWSDAASCLPWNPALAGERGGQEEPRGPGCRLSLRNESEAYVEEKEWAVGRLVGTQEGPWIHLQGEPCSVEARLPSEMAETCGFTDSPHGGTVDLEEEEMEQSVSGLVFSLDPSSASLPLHLSNSALTVTFQDCSSSLLRHCAAGMAREESSPRALEPQESQLLPNVCADTVITRGQFYWEVDVCNSICYSIGVSSLDGTRAWWMERRGGSFSAVFDGRREPLVGVPPQLKTVGVFLNMGGGALSFHNPLTQEHLTTLPSRFGPGVRPALGLGQGRLKLHTGLPPPPHIFLSRQSDYRGPAGAGRGRWHRDAPFQSVRSFIQKFEELSVSDSVSGLVSSFGSCTALTSPPEPYP